MTGKWTFAATGPTGITAVCLEVKLSRPVTTMAEAMQVLADIADIEADQQHGETL